MEVLIQTNYQSSVFDFLRRTWLRVGIWYFWYFGTFQSWYLGVFEVTDYKHGAKKKEKEKIQHRFFLQSLEHEQQNILVGNLKPLRPGRHLCPGVPVCNFSLSVPVVIYIPCVPVVICVPVSQFVISCNKLRINRRLQIVQRVFKIVHTFRIF